METIIVTGAAGGIGRETVRMLASSERHLLCVDRSEQGLRQLANDRLSGKITTLVSDLSTLQDCQEIVSAADGPLHGLVFLAGVFLSDEPLNDDPTVWDRVIDANLKSAYMLTGEVMKSMVPESQGILVYASSGAFRRGAPFHIAYAISKAGLAGMIRSLARRHGPRIRVNGVAPGPIETAMTKSILNKRAAEFTSIIPLQRIGRPHEVASVIAFLCSPGASYINSQIINVDGGMVPS